MTAKERVDAVVVGAGVVGLATARALARRGREVIVLEAADTIGSGISSRNSEVIHAGIYYPRESLKARLCVAGKAALYAYCESRGVPHARCGKLVVAVREPESSRLERVRQAALANGVTDLEWLTAADVLHLEPEVECVSALLSPSTGIVEAHALMLSLTGEIEAAGGHVVTATAVTGIERAAGRLVVATNAAGEMALEAQLTVVAAGLNAQGLASRIRGFPGALVPPLYLCKGNYFVLSGAKPFSRLVYPVPDRHSLGVHATIDLSGSVRFGPDIEWLDRDDYDYEVDPARAERFYEAIRRYYPGLEGGSLVPGYAGIRPKTMGPAGAAQDFQIQGPDAHGIPGLVAMFGIESPGLTASLAIGQYACQLLDPGDALISA